MHVRCWAPASAQRALEQDVERRGGVFDEVVESSPAVTSCSWQCTVQPGSWYCLMPSRRSMPVLVGLKSSGRSAVKLLTLGSAMLSVSSTAVLDPPLTLLRSG